MSVPPTWTPQLEQTITTVNGETVYGDVYFNLTNEGPETTQFNVYSLSYSTIFQLISGTFTIPGVPAGVGPRDTDVPAELINMRRTLIGVIPLLNLSSNNTRTPITFSFPTNSYAISVVSFNKDYYVIPQPSGDPTNTVGVYTRPGAPVVRLPYRNALVINGIYDVSGGYRYDQVSTTLRMEISQASYEPSMIGDDTVRFSRKSIVVPLTLTKALTNIGIKPFSGVGDINTIPGSDANGIITREYLDGFIDLSFSQFARTDRKILLDGSPDYRDVIYYLSLTGTRTFQIVNDNVTIADNKITFNKVTVLPDGNHTLIPIKFLQEETPVYKRSTQRIGETPGFVEQPDPPVSPPVTDITRTIRLKINKSTPTFVGQIPAANTADPLQVYRLSDLNKMTTEVSFILTPPLSNNSDSSSNFLFSSSNDSLLKIRVSGGAGTGIGTAGGAVYTAYIYGSGTATITITQPATTNFNQKVAYFDVNIFEITPAIINCNTNLFYTNPYNREFWTRFKPECRSSDLVDSVTGAKLTATQVDEVYDMRRKAEILKYNKNVGGLTKSQKYAKASRGELMRKIGNESNYLSGVGGSAFTLTCPTTPANRAVLCGLTTACGVPGKERLLCYDPSVNLYNYKRTYTYEAGLQVTLDIPTTILTEPLNLRITSYDSELNKITLVWDAPESNGGFPITGYVITYSKDNKTWAPYKSVFPYNPATAGAAAGVIASAAATAAGANAAAAASAANLASAAVIKAATYNPVSGEINGNSVVFEAIDGSVEIRANTVYYLSVFSGNVRGLSSVPATITVKTSSVPSIIGDFGFTNPADERQNLMVDLKWTDPLNTGTSAGGGYNGPPIRQYNLYYRKVPDTVWLKQTLDISSIIISTNGGSGGGQSRRYILRNLLNENKYEIKIEPINTVGVGAESAIITARTLMTPTAPSGVLVTAKYGILPPVIVGTSGNYINIIWSKPNTGGSPIKLYNITITPPTPIGSSISTSITIPYNISTTDTRTTYSSDIGRIGPSVISDGLYSVTISAFNGYLYSNESAISAVTVKPKSAKPSIYSIEGTYTSAGLSYAELTFYIVTEIVGAITLVKVNGLNNSYSTNLNIYSQNFAGLVGITGEHKIRIPATSAGREVIVVGTTYSVSVTLVFNNGLEQTSELFSYTPEIKYLTT